MNTQPQPSRALEPIGRRLRAAREVRGVSLGQIEAATHIRRAYLEAIEAGRAEDFPAEVFLKGFLRGYADQLGLDGAALVEDYKRAQAAEAEAAEARPETASRRGVGERPRQARRPAGTGRAVAATVPSGYLLPAGVLAGAVVVVVLLLVLLHGPHHPASVRHLAVSSPATHPARPASSPSTARSTTSATSASSAVGATTPPAGGPQVQVTPARTNLGWQVTYTVRGASSLQVALRTGSAACWVRRWTDGTLAQPDVTLQPGQSVSWSAAANLRLLLGWAPGIAAIRVDGLPTPPLPPVDGNTETLIFQLAAGSASTAG